MRAGIGGGGDFPHFRRHNRRQVRLVIAQQAAIALLLRLGHPAPAVVEAVVSSRVSPLLVIAAPSQRLVDFAEADIAVILTRLTPAGHVGPGAGHGRHPHRLGIVEALDRRPARPVAARVGPQRAAFGEVGREADLARVARPPHVAAALRQQENLLVRARRPIDAGRIRHRVRLPPHDLGAHPPARILQRDRQPVRDHAQVLGLQPSGQSGTLAGGERTGWRIPPAAALGAIQRRPGTAGAGDVERITRLGPVNRSHRAERLVAKGAVVGAARLGVGRAAPVRRGRVAIAVIEPQRAGGLEHPAHFLEYLHHRRDVRAQRRLQPQLPRHPIVAQPPIRRRGDAAVHAVRRQLPELRQRVADDDLVARTNHHTRIGISTCVTLGRPLSAISTGVAASANDIVSMSPVLRFSTSAR